MKKYEAYENILLAISGHLKDQEIISDSLKLIKQSLTTPKISDSEVEELFDYLEQHYIEQHSYMDIDDFTPLDRDEKWKSFKTYITQMQQKNERQLENNEKLVNLNHRVIEKNQQYKQLLDKIGDITYTPLDEESNFKEFKRLDNILKQLKSIGAK